MNESKKKPQKIINLPETTVPQKPLTVREMEKNSRRRVAEISEEFRKGFSFIKHHPKSITLFGSARFDENNPYYQKARRIAKSISKLGYAVVTGGGPGIMEAGNRGALEGDGNEHSIGICIRLPHEQITNPYVTDGLEFKYFFSRKVILSFSAEAYVYFPGGFGTMDELFEALTLIQTGRMDPMPILLFGEEFWRKIINWEALAEAGTIGAEDLELFQFVETADEAWDILQNWDA